MNRLSIFQEQALSAELAKILFRVVAAQIKRTQLRVAVMGADIAKIMDFGEILLSDERINISLSYFGKERDFYKQSYDDLNPRQFDCYLLVDSSPTEIHQMHSYLHTLYPSRPQLLPVIDWLKFQSNALTAIGQIDDAHTCLNHQKLFALASAIETTPELSTILECGVFKGGGTVFLGKMSQIAGRSPSIFALDTFEGLPEPSKEDTESGIHYPAGFFHETSIDGVRNTYKRFGLEDLITPVQGLVQNTIPQIMSGIKPGNILALLDMDQYAGIYAAVHSIITSASGAFLIFIDDTSIPGVDAAILDACVGQSIFRARISHNFDILIR